jgi:hypothetical protein
MNNNEILIEEFRALRREIDTRIKILHLIIILASIFWLVLIIAGIIIERKYTITTLYNYLLLIPIIFTGIVFNYQDNQRTLEGTARYMEFELKPKLQKEFGDDVFQWEQWFARYKKRYQISSSFKIFALIAPFFIPILLLISTSLNSFQTKIAILDIVLLIIIIINFRYKLYRIK